MKKLLLVSDIYPDDITEGRHLRVNNLALSILAKASKFPAESTMARHTGVSELAIACFIMIFIAAFTWSNFRVNSAISMQGDIFSGV